MIKLIVFVLLSTFGLSVSAGNVTFEVYDVKFGVIETEDIEWIEKARDTGSLEDRENSCRVTEEKNELSFPMKNEFPTYGLTFEYREMPKGTPVRIMITNSYEGGDITTGETFQLKAAHGRFCYSQSGEFKIQYPGQHCYHAYVNESLIDKRCINLLNSP